MSFKMLKSVNFGRSLGGLATVGYTLYDTLGSQALARITGSVHEVGPSTGIYAATIEFPNEFSGSILWDTGGANPQFASEDYNPTDERIKFNYDMTGGRWFLDKDEKTMTFYSDDNETEIAKFDMADDRGRPSVEAIFERTRLS